MLPVMESKAKANQAAVVVYSFRGVDIYISHLASVFC